MAFIAKIVFVAIVFAFILLIVASIAGVALGHISIGDALMMAFAIFMAILIGSFAILALNDTSLQFKYGIPVTVDSILKVATAVFCIGASLAFLMLAFIKWIHRVRP